jgi:hypothetical protein
MKAISKYRAIYRNTYAVNNHFLTDAINVGKASRYVTIALDIPLDKRTYL